MILRNAYNDPKAAEWLSQRIERAGGDAAVLGRAERREAKDLFGLFDDTLDRLLAANR